MRAMSKVLAVGLPLVLGCSGSCLGSGDGGGLLDDGGTGKLVIDGQIIALEGVHMELYEDFFQLHGSEPNTSDDCYTPTAGVFFYGDVPAGGVAALAGQRVPIEFSGDGDDAEVGLCSKNAFWGARPGSYVEFSEASDSSFTATFGGTFDRYDTDSGEQAVVPSTIAGQLSGPVRGD